MCVEFDPAFGPFDCSHFASKAFDLRVAGDPGLDPMAPGIAANRFMIETVADHHFRSMRPRADKRHAALKNVQQLRQLIDTESAQKPADRRYSRIVFRGRLTGAEIRLVRVHAAELEDVDGLIVESDPWLNEEHRTRAGQPNEKRRDQEHRRENDERKRAQQLIVQNMMLRREADASGDVQISSLLESLEPILIDIANLPAKPDKDAVRAIRERVERKNIVALLQVNSTALARALD